MNGLAGTGKSTIAKTVAERLFADGQLGASFFCSRDFEDRRNLHLIFPTLATQLARKYTKFRLILTPLIQSDPNIAYESLYSQMEKLIVRPLNESGISTAIVIDALDECEDEEPASVILSVIGRLVSEIPEVKFFLTGRPETHVSVGFRLPLLAKMTDVFILHAVEPDQVSNDIQLFFKTSFSELVDRQRGLDNWPTKGQLDRLCERAAGLFVYAAATFKFIDSKRRDPRTQLDLLLQSEKIGVREGKSLDSLYTSILQEGFGDSDPEYDAKTRSVLGAVVLVANPLSPSAIAMLLGFDAKDVPPLLSSASSLLILQEDVNCPVRPFHKSFPDFITDPIRCTNPRFHISPPDHHAQLLISCFSLMDRALQKNMCKLPDGVANSDIGDLKERTERHINPALRYACTSWHTHLVGLVDGDTVPSHAPTIIPTLRQFLETKFLCWLDVLSVLGAVKNAVEALQVTTDWLEVCRVSVFDVQQSYSDQIQESPTLDLADDCLRFVTGYFEIISTSSPHIYRSALAVAPENSIVRKLYESQAHPFTRVVCGVPVLWDASTASATCPSRLGSVVWSPCNRFIASTLHGTRTVDVFDSATLQRIQTIESPREMFHAGVAPAFSPDSRILTWPGDDWISPSDEEKELSIVNWDLQTGGMVNIISLWKGLSTEHRIVSSITYSAIEKIVGVFCRHSGDFKPDFKHSHIFICDVASGALVYSHSLDNIAPLSAFIWTHGKFMRFATTKAKAITIWEVGFTSGAPLTEVETLPTPDSVDRGDWGLLLLPAPCRLAIVPQDMSGVLVWDVRNSKYLLDCTDDKFFPMMSFSFDGQLFACSTTGSDIYLWKESLAGYVLHGMLASRIQRHRPLFAQNGQSIIMWGDRTIQLWPTKGFATPPSSILTQATQNAEDFIVEFSPDGLSAVVAKRKGSTVTVLNLESGVPQLTIDAGMEVCGLGVIGNTIIVMGNWKAITWDLPAADCVPGACVGLEGSSRTIDLSDSPHGSPISSSYSLDSRDSIDVSTGASISPDFHHIALFDERHLSIYSTSTGKLLWKKSTYGNALRFSQDGHNVWCAHFDREVEVWGVNSKQERLGFRRREINVELPPEGYPWASSCGYRVTRDWWVLGPDGNRLLLLPPSWQSYAVLRVWKGRFLALLHSGLSELVILEFDVNRNL